MSLETGGKRSLGLNILRHIGAIIIAGVIFLAILVALFFSSNTILTAIVHNYGVVEVPDISNIELNHARGILNDLSLKLEIAEFEHHELPEGRIISQIPSRGRKVYKNRTIQVNVSLGQKIIIVPVLTGLSFSNINEMMRMYELRVGNIVQHYSSDVATGFIIRTVPEAGTTIMAGSAVDVVVSIGRDPLDVVDIKVEPLPEIYFFDEEIF